ncbi:WD40 domain-containing protein [Thalassoglobus neptunius]|uniref:WD40 domain-containing protein n=1 Tax=Thalassoglobus neptunius TaxID=1938619 RepID=UPI001E4800F8|nr:c-type cytochrome domain-containing protein [Thalassoglobus neptunius]
MRADEKDSKSDEKPVEKITFDDHVLPVFRARCGSCHNANDRRGGLVLDQYAGVMEGGSSGEVVDPGSAEFSYLWLLVNHEDSPKMPPNADKLPESELAVIRKWIDMGALENAGSKAKIKKRQSLARIEVSTERPAHVAMPQSYFGDPVVTPLSTNAVTALATSPWAPIVAVSGHQQVSLHNSQTREPLGVLPFPEGQPQIMKFSRNGSLLMVGGGRGGQSGKVVVYDVATGERRIEAGAEYDEVLAADISSDQMYIALGGPKKMVRVYSVTTGDLVYENKKHTDWVTAIEFSPDGVLLASGDRSNGLVIWEADTGRIFYELNGHRGAITDVSWRPDSNVLASSSEDGTIKLWEMQNGTNIKSWNAHGGGALSVEYTRTGQVVSTGRDKMARLWDGDGKKLKDFGGFKDIGMEVAFDADSKVAIAGDWSGEIRFWNADDGALLGTLNTNPPTVSQYLSSLEPQLAEARQAHQKAAEALAKLTAGFAQRQAASQQAAKELETAEKALAETTSQMTAAKNELQNQEAELAKANTQVNESQKQLAEAQTSLQASEAELKPIQANFEQLTAKTEQLKAAKEASARGFEKATETFEILTQAASPTAQETAANDPAVATSLEKRSEVAKTAEATVTLAKIVAEQAASQYSKGAEQLQVVTTAFQAAQKKLATAKMNVANLEKQHAANLSAQQKVQQQIVKSKTQLAELKAKADGQTASRDAAKEKAATLAKAAELTEEENAKLQSTKAAAEASQKRLEGLESQFDRLSLARNELASAQSE